MDSTNPRELVAAKAVSSEDIIRVESEGVVPL